MKKEHRRGRVPGRLRDKEIEEELTRGASWDQLHRGAVFGELEAEHIVIAREWHALLKRSEELGLEYRRLGDRVRKALVEWLTIARGEETEVTDLGHTPDEVFKGAKKDKNRDDEVYRLYRKDNALSGAIFKLDRRMDYCAGDLFRRAVCGGDDHPLRLLEALVQLFRSKPFRSSCLTVDRCEVNSRHALYLEMVGKDETGKVRRTARFSVSLLARICDCDRKTIRDWHKRYGVTSTQGKRGPRKKS
jgi:hypothetical protein